MTHEDPSSGDDQNSGAGLPVFVPAGGGMPRCVLLVEDNAIISLDTEQMLQELGVAIVISASSNSEALAAIEAGLPDFALLDVNLGVENAFVAARRLRDLRIRFAFVTGYGEDAVFPAEFVKVPRVLKPYSSNALKKALSE